MNVIISAVVGGLVATAVLIGGVNAYQGGAQRSVSQTTLYAYSDE